jgi:hypothetical protein
MASSRDASDSAIKKEWEEPTAQWHLMANVADQADRIPQLQKLHAHKCFFPPHDAARAARLVEIKDKIKGVLQDWFVSLQFGPRFRNVANSASHGSTVWPDNLCAF